MKQATPFLVIAAAVLLAAALVLPAAAVAPAQTTAMMPGSDRDAHGCIGSAGYTWCEAKQKCVREWEEPCAGGSPVQYITVTVSSATVAQGSPVTVSGTSAGPGKTVQIWAFAGNYVNVSEVPVSADGRYAKTYGTAGLPPATYYVFAQNPGSDSTLAITTTSFAGTVVNAKTGAVIFNFTGTGSVHDAAAAKALSDALNAQGGDDLFAKTQFAIEAAGAQATAAMPGSDRDAHGCIGSAGYTWCEAKQKCLREWEEPCAAAAPSATKSPLPAGLAALGVAGALALLAGRKDR